MKITQKGYIRVPDKLSEELDFSRERDFFVYKRGCSFSYVPWFNLNADCNKLKIYLDKLEKSSLEEISEIAGEIIYRQFYHGDDNIVDRTETQYVKVKGTKEILSKVNDMVQSKIELWCEGEYGEFFKEISKILKVNPSMVINDFLKKVERDSNLGGSMISDLTSGSVFALAIGKTMLNFHEKVHDEFVFNLLQYNFEFKNSNAFQKRWEEIAARLSTEDSLLLNLQILSELGTITGHFVSEEVKLEKIEQLITQIKSKKPSKTKKRRKKTNDELPSLPSFP
ncbi:MAG: hypothetical protein KAR35_05685 [Candidatus Heimdallarchaeota archaeon]|nr:hypothetical protein [Candidatus Heimdallarchaeota archaeon]MCK5048850.1 hypothetical protein [Candidatus Heimdallarchaeota archaeon]